MGSAAFSFARLTDSTYPRAQEQKKNSVKKHGIRSTCCGPVDGVTHVIHTHTKWLVESLESFSLSCNNFCKIVSLFLVENTSFKVTVISVIDEPFRRKSWAPEFLFAFPAMLAKLAKLAEALVTFAPALEHAFYCFPV